MAKIYGQLESAQAENLAADPANLPDGRIWLNTATPKLKVVIGAAAKSLVTEDGTQTLTNKTLTSPVINTPTGIVKGDVGLGNVDNTSDATKNSAAVILTNKTISGASNTITNVSLATGVTGTLPIANGGTGQTTAQAAIDALVPSQATNSGKFLTTDGTNTSWANQASSPTQSYELANLGLAASVAANALTIALKQSDGTSDPAAGSGAVKIGFRNSTATTGGYVQRSVTAATSVTVSSGSTLGMRNGISDYVYVYAIDNAGTVELGVSTSDAFDNGSLQTSTAEGGAGAADTRNVLYSTTARASKAVRLIGRIKISEVTAGTWATGATEVSIWPFTKYIADLPVLKAYGTPAGVLAGGVIIFPSVRYDNKSGFSGGQYTVQSTGYYQVNVTVNTSTASNGIYTNVDSVASDGDICITASSGFGSGSDVVYAEKGQIIDVRATSACTFSSGGLLSIVKLCGDR